MKNAQKLFLVFVVMFIAIINVSCGKKYTVKFISDEKIVKEIEVKKSAVITSEEISKDGYEFIGWYLGDNEFDFNTPIDSNLELEAKWKEVVTGPIYADFEIAGTVEFYDNATTKLTAKVTSEGEKPSFEWEIEDLNIADVDGKNKTSLTLFVVLFTSTDTLSFSKLNSI